MPRGHPSGAADLIGPPGRERKYLGLDKLSPNSANGADHRVHEQSPGRGLLKLWLDSAVIKIFGTKYAILEI
jgi:hypothetical protein